VAAGTLRRYDGSMKFELSMPFRIALKAVLNVLLVYAMNRFIPQYFSVFGGWPAFVVVGSLLTLLNLILRPILKLLTLPLKAFATLLTIISVNGFFLWVVYQITLRMDPNLILMVIGGGLGGWIVVSMIIGLANWVMKIVLK